MLIVIILWVLFWAGWYAYKMIKMEKTPEVFQCEYSYNGIQCPLNAAWTGVLPWDESRKVNACDKHKAVVCPISNPL